MHEAKAAVPKGGVFRSIAGGAHLKPRAAAGISATATINPCRGTSLRCRTTGQTQLSTFGPSHRRPPFWDATIFALMTRSKTVDPRTGPPPVRGYLWFPQNAARPFRRAQPSPIAGSSLGLLAPEPFPVLGRVATERRRSCARRCPKHLHNIGAALPALPGSCPPSLPTRRR